MKPLKLGTLLAAAAAAQISRELSLRSASICDSSDCYLSAEGGSGKTYERKKLPAELSALGNVAELTCESAARGGVCHVFLIGTTHGTQKSNEEVKALIELVKPEVVYVELCPRRALNLKYAFLGGEFYVANKEAMKYGGDRDIDITYDRCRAMPYLLQRLFAPFALSYLNLMQMIAKKLIMENTLERSWIKAHLLEHLVGPLELSVKILQKSFEKDGRGACLITIRDERDQYMSVTLLEIASKHNSVVAIVGEGHLEGIQKNWKQPVNMEQLLEVPTRNRMFAFIRRIAVGIVLQVWKL